MHACLAIVALSTTGGAARARPSSARPPHRPDAASLLSLARADLADRLARSPIRLAAGEKVIVRGIVWTGREDLAFAQLLLVLPADARDPFALPPAVVIGAYSMNPMTSPHITARPVPRSLTSALAVASHAAATALPLARARLRTLGRYRSWRRAGLAHTTVVYHAVGVFWVVQFDTPGRTDQTVTVIVDAVHRVVTKVELAAA